MSHHCKSLIIHCIDFRLQEAVKAYLEEHRLLGHCDVVSVAGAIKDIVAPTNKSDREFILRQVDISKKLHGISEVIFMNHTDCGAYRGSKAFVSPEEEREHHIEEMRNAEEFILTKHPDLTIRTVLARINPSGDISFEEIDYP